MKKTVFSAILLLGLISIISSDASAQNRITGFVFDEARRPIPQIWVELLDEGYSTIARTQTGGTGLYNFSRITSGQYVVRVLVGGTSFLPQSQMVSFSGIQGARIGSEQIDFYLKVDPKAGTPRLSAPGVVFAQDVPNSARRLYDAGVSDLENNREEGLVKIREAIEAFPAYYDALDRLGNEYLNRGHFEAAYILLTKATEINSKSLTSHIGRGISAFRLGRNSESVSSLEKAVEIDSASINANLWYGIALHSVKKYDQAITSLKKANNLPGGDVAEVHWQLARVYKDQGKYAKAADELELYLKKNPNAPNANEVKQIVASLRNKT